MNESTRGRFSLTVSGAAFACVALVGFSSAPKATSFTTSPTPTQGAPVPEEAKWAHAVDDLRLSHGVWATVSVKSRSEVQLKWYYNPGADQVKKGVIARGRQLIQVQGVLSTVVSGQNGKLLLCTKQRNGETRIEEVTVVPPNLIVNQDGPSLVPQPLGARRTLYQAATAGMDTVGFGVRFRGQLDTYMIQFHDSKDLHLLFAGSDPVVVSALLDSDDEPLLNTEFTKCTAGEHSTSGFVYNLSRLEDTGFAVYQSTYLIDSDMDGAFDHIGPLDAATVMTLGLIELENWVEHRGTPTVELLPAN